MTCSPGLSRSSCCRPGGPATRRSWTGSGPRPGTPPACPIRASPLTEPGMVMGTAMYVSPEQATGAQVPAASDISSLGVVAYECLAGPPPFTASEPLAIAFAHKHEPVPALPPDVPQPVSDLVY